MLVLALGVGACTVREGGGWSPASCDCRAPVVPRMRPDAGSTADTGPARDARLDARDAPVPPACGPATLAISARIVEGPSGEPLVGARVRVEGRCDADIAAIAGADGVVTVRVDPAGAPWSLTAAMVGHRAVSILDVTRVAAVGDVRLDVAPLPVYATFPASGTLSGPLGAGNTVRIDGFDFGTLPSAGATWMSEHYVLAGVPVPTRFAAVELGPLGQAVNIAVTAEAARPTGPLGDVALALPTAAETPRETMVAIDLHLGTGSFPVMEPRATELFHVGDHPFEPQLRVGSALFGPSTGGAQHHDVAVRDFGVLPANWLVARFEAASGAVLNVLTTDVGADATIDVGEIYSMWWDGDGTYAGATAFAQTTGYDFIALHLGESAAGDLPVWRVFAPSDDATTTTLHVPRLPAGMTVMDLGIGTPRDAAIVAMAMAEGVVPWGLRARAAPVRGYRVTAVEGYVTLDPAGR